jgi:Undecaprenyl-phosphate galactose phosphotransferase WbaP
MSDFAVVADPSTSYRGVSSRRVLALPSSLFRYRVIKRILDIFLVIVSLPLLLPALFLVGLVVKLTSPGPAFFSHRRICRDGAFFSMWKFRTMCVNSADVLEQYLSKNPKARVEWSKTHKLRRDPRITPVGLFLRRYSLDELPQVWNVLRGEMSLVGPRPIVAAEVEKYADCFEYYCRVKPGVTGLWQVSGRSELTYDQRVALDRRYVTHWSLFFDLKILLCTFRSVVNRDGAY